MLWKRNIQIVDGKGGVYVATIAVADSKKCLVNSLQVQNTASQRDYYLHIAIAPTKNMDRMEWLAEKATEIGWDRVVFLNCRFSERKVVKTDRIERIVVSAMKQSLKFHKTTVEEMTDFKAFVNADHKGAKFIAHCYEESKELLADCIVPGEDATVLIGPEGDFSKEEVETAIKAGFRPVSLGNSRLRTETAGLVACHTFIMKNER